MKPAQSVRWIKDSSGLTWGQIARALGVSPRTLRRWAHGGRLNPANARLVCQLQVLVAEHQQPTAAATRSVLLAPDAPGTGPLDRFRFERFGDADAISGPAFRPREHLGAG